MSENPEVASVGELEWCDANLNGIDTGLMFESKGLEDHDQRWWVCQDYDEDYWYLTNDWMSDDIRIGPRFKTPEGPKSLANSLQRILSGAAE